MECKVHIYNSSLIRFDDFFFKSCFLYSYVLEEVHRLQVFLQLFYQFFLYKHYCMVEMIIY